MGLSHSVPEIRQENAEDFRKLASDEAAKMKQCFAASQAAYKNGQKGIHIKSRNFIYNRSFVIVSARAKELSEAGKQHQNKMKFLNEKASKAAFSHRNSSSDLGTIDLHGLYVAEAIATTEERIKLLRSKHPNIKALVVVTGAGLHSENGVAKLKPAIEAMMTKHNVAVTPDRPNHGCLHVDLYPTKPGWVRSFCTIS